MVFLPLALGSTYNSPKFDFSGFLTKGRLKERQGITASQKSNKKNDPEKLGRKAKSDKL